LIGFEEFLQVDAASRILLATFSAARTSNCKLAATTDPIPLDEVTEQEIKISLGDRKKLLVPGHLMPLPKAKAELRYSEYQAALMCFRMFREAVLKPARKTR